MMLHQELRREAEIRSERVSVRALAGFLPLVTKTATSRQRPLGPSLRSRVYAPGRTRWQHLPEPPALQVGFPPRSQSVRRTGDSEMRKSIPRALWMVTILLALSTWLLVGSPARILTKSGYQR